MTKPIVRFEMAASGLFGSEWKSGKVEVDLVRCLTYVDYFVEHVDLTIEVPHQMLTARGELSAFQRTGPDEFTFSFYPVPPELAQPYPSAEYTAYIRSEEKGKTVVRTFKVMVSEVGYCPVSQTLEVRGIDATPQPEPPQPCEKCAKRAQKKRDKRRLKLGRLKWNENFKTIEELDAYEDAYFDSMDW